MQFEDEFDIFPAMSERKEDLPHQERRLDEELRAALAENSASVAPCIETQGKLIKLRDALYKEHIAPVEAELYDVRRTVLQYEETKKQIEAELKANQDVRDALKKRNELKSSGDGHHRRP